VLYLILFLLLIRAYYTNNRFRVNATVSSCLSLRGRPFLLRWDANVARRVVLLFLYNLLTFLFLFLFLFLRVFYLPTILSGHGRRRRGCTRREIVVEKKNIASRRIMHTHTTINNSSADTCLYYPADTKERIIIFT